MRNDDQLQAEHRILWVFFSEYEESGLLETDDVSEQFSILSVAMLITNMSTSKVKIMVTQMDYITSLLRAVGLLSLVSYGFVSCHPTAVILSPQRFRSQSFCGFLLILFALLTYNAVLTRGKKMQLFLRFMCGR